ncbi:hypothetical protein MVEG_00086 [Podila verticillata NRRL 6337]|nr:hypothetical protein MVEG_00086 [Podila verticillata NRRL 6337]
MNMNDEAYANELKDVESLNSANEGKVQTVLVNVAAQEALQDHTDFKLHQGGGQKNHDESEIRADTADSDEVMIQRHLNQGTFEAANASTQPSGSAHPLSQHLQNRGVASPTYLGPSSVNEPSSIISDNPQDLLPSEEATGTPALVLLGNAGAGKSTLLTQLGGKFESGAVFRKGFTKDVTHNIVVIKDQQVRLIDVPGLFEPNDKETRFNAEKINSALSLGFNYRFYFVLKADNRGPDDKEMVMMSRISECVRKADGSQMSFGVIVNQILSDEVGAMYKELAKDNFRSMFEGLSIPGFVFDIKIDSVIMLPFDELVLGQPGFQDKLADLIDISPASASAVKLVKDISFCNNDLKLYQARHLSPGSGAVSVSGNPSEPPALPLIPARGGAIQYCPPRNQLPDSSNASVPNPKKSILAKAPGYLVSLWNTTISPSHYNSGKTYSPSSHHNSGTSYSPSSHHTSGTSYSPLSHHNPGMSYSPSSHHNSGMPYSPSSHHNTGITDSSSTHHNPGMSYSPSSRHNSGMPYSPSSHHNSSMPNSPSIHYNPGTSYSPSSHHNTGITDSSSTHHNPGMSYSPSSHHNSDMSYGPSSHYNSGKTYSPSSHHNSVMPYSPSSHHNSGMPYSPSSHQNTGITDSSSTHHNPGMSYSPSSHHNSDMSYGPSSHYNSGMPYSPSSHHNSGMPYSPSSHHNTGITDSSSTHLNMGISSGSGSDHNTEMSESYVRHHNLGVSGSSTTHYNTGMTGGSGREHNTRMTENSVIYQNSGVSGGFMTHYNSGMSGDSRGVFGTEM